MAERRNRGNGLNHVKDVCRDSDIRRAREKFESLRTVGANGEKEEKAALERRLLAEIQDWRTPPERKRELEEVLLVANLPLFYYMASKTARQYQKYRISAEDLFSACVEGFYRILERFDLSREGVRSVVSVAEYAMREKMRATVRDNMPSMSVPVNFFQKFRCAEERSAVGEDKSVFGETAARVFAIADAPCLDGIETDVESGNDLERELDDMFEREEILATMREALDDMSYDIVVSRFGFTKKGILSVPSLRKKYGLGPKEFEDVWSDAMCRLMSAFSKAANVDDSSMRANVSQLSARKNKRTA